MEDVLERLKSALADRYAIDREIGSGGMATVYLAEDLKHGRQVAVKVLRPDLAAALGAERFLREIKIAARLHHPHILPLYDSGDANGFLYYVMPYVEGESLRDRLNREKQLPLDDALQVAREVADALGSAHSHDVVHRDIKPENILLEEGHAVVADFGIARAVSAAGGEKLTETGLSIGTPAYMSPEQGSGGAGIDGRSDLYSLACVLYEMLTGHPPFTGTTAQEILVRHATDPVPSIRAARATIPDGVERAVTRALAKVPADRFATATQLGDALTASTALPDVSVKRRRPLGRAAAIALAVVLLVAGSRWAFNTFRTGAERIEWLAVLPPDNLTGDSMQEYFVAGMHDELISKLNQIPGLDVMSRTSAMQYENTDKSIPQIARELNVDAVIESSVLRSGNDVRIQVQLIDAFPRERQLWSETYDRPIGDILALHSEVALAVAEQIQVTLTPEEAGRLATAHVVDPAAYEDYLKGVYQFNKLNLEGWEAAVGHFQQSIDQDPSYAPAYAMLSLTYSFGLGYYSRAPPAVLHSRALAAAQRAVTLDNSLAEAHASLAMVKTTFGWDWAAADRASQEALRLNPNSTMPLVSRAWFLSMVGRPEEAIAIAKRAVELDPVAPHVNTWLGVHYFLARRYDESIEQLNKVVALEPDYRDAHIWLSYLYARKGMFEDAARESALVTGYRQSWWPEAWVLAVAGRSADARELLQQAPTEQRGRPIDASFLAMVLGELGERDRAFALLEQAYQGRSSMMSALKVDPRLDSLRDDPRFDDLLRRMNFPN